MKSNCVILSREQVLPPLNSETELRKSKADVILEQIGEAQILQIPESTLDKSLLHPLCNIAFLRGCTPPHPTPPLLLPPDLSLHCWPVRRKLC